MTDEAKRCIEALRVRCRERDSCDGCAKDDYCHHHGDEALHDFAAYLIESLAAELEQVKRERDGLQAELDALNEEYFSDVHTARDPMLDKIRQLECERNELAEKCRQLEARNDTLIAKEVLFDEAIAAGAKMQCERDAYFDSMKGICATCKKAKYCMLNPLPKCPNWQWRGVKE